MSEENIAKTCKVGVVVARFNQLVTQALLDGVLSRARELGISDEHVPVVWVPGAVELPLVAQQMAKTVDFDAVICLGAVIRGETSHYDYVCDQVSAGCQKVALQYDIPVIFAVLTTENRQQAMARAGGERGNKGCDAIDAALEMIDVMRKFQE